MEYLDFDLEVEAEGGRDYRVVVHSPEGDTRTTIRFPFDELALDHHLTKLQLALLRSGGLRRAALSVEEQSVQNFGQQLFETLLGGNVRALYDACRTRAAQEGRPGVRLRLRILAPDLAALPWEYLYDPRRGEYLCLSKRTPLVRYPEVAQPVLPLQVTPPLRILAMVASPSDLPVLEETRERERLRVALAGLEGRGLVKLEWLEGQTWRDLQRAMRGGPWHVFHFIGHGGFHPQTQEGVLAFATEAGKTHLLGATQLGYLLSDHTPLRLAVLNACEGAKSNQRDLFSSTAATLARHGLPAVLAMQYEITDRAAIECSRAFYEALADGLSVEAALAEARTAIHVGVNNSLEWGTPVLFLRAPTGMLFMLSDLPTPTPHPAPLPAALQPEPAPPVAKTTAPPARPTAGSSPVTPASAAPASPKVPASERPAAASPPPAEAPPPTQRQPAPATPASPTPAPGEARHDASPPEVPERVAVAPARATTSETPISAPPPATTAPAPQAPTSGSAAPDPALTGQVKAPALATSQSTLPAPSSPATRQKPPAKTTDQWVAEGDQHRRAGRAQEALACYWQAIQVDPTNARAYTGRGYVLWQLGHQEKALEAFEQAIQRNVDAAEAFTGKGAVLSTLKRYEEALFAYEHALQLDPNYTAAWNDKGNVLRDLKRSAEALNAYEHALQLDPNYAAAWNNKGNVLRDLKRYEKALAAYERALQLAPEDADALQSKETLQKELARQEAERQEAWKEAVRREEARKETERQGAAREEAARLEVARKEAERQELARREVARKKAERQELARQEAEQQELARQEAAPIGTLLLTLTGHSARFTRVVWSPDGRRLASFSTQNYTIGNNWDDDDDDDDDVELAGPERSPADTRILLWDAASGQRLATLQGHMKEVHAVVWSPDGRRLASASGDGTVRLWDAMSGHQHITLRVDDPRVLTVAWSSNGRLLASARHNRGGYGAYQWDAESGKKLATLGHTYTHITDTYGVWSPDGRRFASCGFGLRLWDAESGKPPAILLENDRVDAVAWSPDGRRLASAVDLLRDKAIHLWDAESGKLLATLKGHKGDVKWMVWSPDGQRLAASIEGLLDTGVRLWDTESGKLLTTLKVNGKLLTTLKAMKNDSYWPVASMVWSPDGRRLATASAAVLLWDTATGKLLSTIKVPKWADSGPPHQVAWSPDGRRLASASAYEIRVWWVGEGSK